MAPSSRTKSSAASKATATPAASQIVCTSQQSRFHTETLDTTAEVDLKGVNVSIGELDLLVDTHLRLKEGVKYALVGRNGTGKSTILTAIAEKLIPGLSPSLRILLLSQVEDSLTSATPSAEAGEGGKPLSVLEHVVRGDKARLAAVEEHSALVTATETSSAELTQKIVYALRLKKLHHALAEAKKIALRRSGARGKEARNEEVKAEQRVAEMEAIVEAASQPGATVEADIMQQAIDMLADASLTLSMLDTDTTEPRAASILSGLGFSTEMTLGPYSALSGGWRSRCSLATSLLVKSDVLLLDEPSNFLDLEAIIWLEDYLGSLTQTVVLISHDQEFLNNTVEETIILRNKTFKYFEGTPTAFDINEKKERTKLIGQKEALDKKREHIEKSIQQGIASAKKTGDENRQRMVKSRQKKLDERFGAETSAKGTRFKLNRDMAGYHLSNRSAIEIEAQEAAVKLKIENPEKLRTLGDLIHFDKVAYKFPKASKPLLEDVTFTVDQGGRCALIGANGNGKSTIAKMIMGRLKPTSGTITKHPLLKIGFFDQHSVEQLSGDLSHLSLDGPVTALSYFLNHFEQQGEKVSEQDARKCLGSFGLKGSIASGTPLSHLSGGQKVRLAFSLIIYNPPPLLLLDEVTTHLDAPTIHALAKALRRYTGAIICVTHDRFFSRIVVEGSSLRSLQMSAVSGEADESDLASSSSDDDDDDPSTVTTKRETYKVGGGKIRLQDKGMTQYVEFVRRRLAKKKKEEAAKGTA